MSKTLDDAGALVDTADVFPGGHDGQVLERLANGGLGWRNTAFKPDPHVHYDGTYTHRNVYHSKATYKMLEWVCIVFNNTFGIAGVTAPGKTTWMQGNHQRTGGGASWVHAAHTGDPTPRCPINHLPNKTPEMTGMWFVTGKSFYTENNKLVVAYRGFLHEGAQGLSWYSGGRPKTAFDGRIITESTNFHIGPVGNERANINLMVAGYR